MKSASVGKEGDLAMSRVMVWMLFVAGLAILAGCHATTSPTESSCSSALDVEVLNVRIDFDDVCASNAHTVDVVWSVDGACGDYVAEVVASYASGESQIVSSDLTNTTSFAWHAGRSADIPRGIRVTVRDRRNETYDEFEISIVMPGCRAPDRPRPGSRIPEVIAP